MLPRRRFFGTDKEGNAIEFNFNCNGIKRNSFILEWVLFQELVGLEQSEANAEVEDEIAYL